MNQEGMDDIIRYVLSEEWDSSDYISHNPLGQGDPIQENEFVESIKGTLFFDSMRYREAKIPERCSETYEWIYNEPFQSEDGRPLWHSFAKWLEEDSDQIYWITGKPGSGKSTLLKFIDDDERSQRLLARWANGGELLMGSYFSWKAGTQKLQKTHEGLLRTLLFEVFKQNKPLAARAFPGRWFLLQAFGLSVGLPKPRIDELMRAFRMLLSETSMALRILLLIDGLDEFEEDHRELVTLLREANQKPWVKICTSSRPWNVFKDEYTNNPMLQMEKLTHGDIKLYVREKFEHNCGFREYQGTNPEMSVMILDDIVKRAKGVFLWVTIVSDLLEGIFLEGGSQDDFKSIIDSLPNEVSELFMYIWDRTDVKFRTEASQYFQVMKAYDEQDTVPYCLTFWLGDIAVPVDMKAENTTSEYVSEAVKSLARKLISRTGGILEIIPHATDAEGSRVEFMHQTAADWVDTKWDTITTLTADKDFDPKLWVLKGQMLQVSRKIELGRGTQTDEQLREELVSLFKQAATIADTPSNRTVLAGLLDRLNEQLSKIDDTLYNDHRNFQRHWYNRGESMRYRQESEFRLFAGDIDFLSYMARYPIVPYIKHKLEQSPNIFSTHHDNSGVLENMVFGPCCGFQLQSTLRLDLIQLLLQKGVCLEEVRKTMRLALNWDGKDMDICEYLGDVMGILDNCKLIDERGSRLKRKGFLSGLKSRLVTYFD